MRADLTENLKRQVYHFQDLLRQNGYFYDVNQLHAFFRYTQAYSPRAVKNYWEVFVGDHQVDDKTSPGVDFYIHIPFCRSRCAYCQYPSWPFKNSKQLDEYVDYLLESMSFFHDTFSKVTFRNLYMGGGTPSILNGKQMKRLLSGLFKYFSFYDDSQKTSECNPHSVRKSTFSLLRDFGFSRVSLGVQSLSPKTLKMNKREYQRLENIKKVITLARKSGLKDINIDLIIGLAGDKLSSFARSFGETAKLKPANIVVYGLIPPNQRYLTECLKMTREEYFSSHYPAVVSGAVVIMRSLSNKFGYLPDSVDQARFHWGFRHRDSLDFGVSQTYSGEFSGCIFGLGSFSRSHIHSLFEYRHNKHSIRFNPDEEIYTGRQLTRKEEMIKFIINQIDQDSRIHRQTFRAVFGAEVIHSFPYAIYALKQLKKIKITDNYINFSFRKPEEKYIYTLFFLPWAGKRES